jgi:hypothetical protein
MLTTNWMIVKVSLVMSALPISSARAPIMAGTRAVRRVVVGYCALT